MKTIKLLLLAFVAGSLILNFNSGCTKDRETINIPPPPPPPPSSSNKSPIANAGPDQTIMKPRNYTLLSGNLSNDSDGYLTNYQWRTVAGPNSPDLNNDIWGILEPYEKFVSKLDEGVYLFELMITDDGSATARDTIQVTVLQDSLSLDPSHMKRFDKLQCGSFDAGIWINNISSAVPIGGGIKVYISSDYMGNSTEWRQAQSVRSLSEWFEIINDVLIIHPPANIDCSSDVSVYDVLIKWN